MELPKSLGQLTKYGLEHLPLREESRQKMLEIQTKALYRSLIYQGFFVSALMIDKILLMRRNPKFLKKNPFLFFTFNFHFHFTNLILMFALGTKTEKRFKNDVIDILAEYEKEISVLKLSHRFL